ncbi:MAG: ATP-binding protein [Caldilineaceae bacterium]
MTLEPLALLIRTLPEPTLLVTDEGMIVAANAPAAALLQLPTTAPEQPLTAHVANPPDQLERFLRLWARNRQLMPGMLMVRTPGGAPVRHRCQGAVVLPTTDDAPALLLLRIEKEAAAGSTFNLLTQKIDELSNEIRERMAAEQQLQVSEARLRDLATTLELRVQQRTAELERSNQELDQFAYVASHDLRAPLRAIDHLATWIAEDAGALLPPASQKHLTQLRERVARMDQLLDDLLTYARIGRTDDRVEPVAVATLLADTITFLAPPPGFQIHSTSILPTFDTLRVPLELIIRNLLSNAIKHHHQPANGKIEIAVQALDDFWEFCIGDNGPGIALQYHERIFGLFQTLQARNQVEGSGMGLAIVKKAVEQQGGAIRIESTEGQGTTFYFTWPQVIRADR